MVADAQAIEQRSPFKDVVSEQAADFRGSFSGYERDRLFYNPNGSFEGFVQSAYVFGLDDDGDGRSVAPVDIDGDGDLDVVMLTAQGLRLLENTSSPRHFARVRLAGAQSQAQALGAIVKVSSGGITRQDFVKITDGFRTQVPFDLHFGLGQTTTLDSLEVRWPSGKVEVWRDLPVDQLLLVSEGARAVEARPLERWPDSTRPPAIEVPSSTVEARRLDGEMTPVAGGRPAVINFWAPWCAPCKVELPQLVSLAERYDGEVDFAGVSVELKDLDSVRSMIEQFKIPYAQFLTDDAVMQRFFGSGDQAALPSTYVFDQDGRLRRVFRGAITEADLDSLLLSFRDEGVTEADLSLLGRQAFEAGDYAKAIDAYRRLAGLEPESLLEVSVQWEHRRAVARFWLGVARLRSGRSGEAVGDLQAARRLLGEDPAVLLQLGIAATGAGQLDLAADVLQQVIGVRPDSAQAWIQKGRVHRARGEIEAARDSYDRALSLNPTSEEARRERAGLETAVPSTR